MDLEQAPAQGCDDFATAKSVALGLNSRGEWWKWGIEQVVGGAECRGVATSRATKVYVSEAEGPFASRFCVETGDCLMRFARCQRRLLFGKRPRQPGPHSAAFLASGPCAPFPLPRCWNRPEQLWGGADGGLRRSQRT
jgi:hypothetical protein